MLAYSDGIEAIIRSCCEDANIYIMKDGRDVRISGIEMFQQSSLRSTVEHLRKRLHEPRLVDYIKEMQAGRARRKQQNKNEHPAKD